jgi:hypothetical protein
MKPTYYTSDELAREIGVSAMTIRNRVNAGTASPDAHTASGKRLFRMATMRRMKAAEEARKRALAPKMTA